MPFQVVYTTTFKEANPPSIESYLDTLGPEVLVNYPDVTGQTPLEVYHTGAATSPLQRGPSVGFISESSITSEDGRVVSLTHLWDSEESWLAVTPSSPPLNPAIAANLTPQTANADIIPTAYKFVSFLYNYAYIANVTTTTSNV